MFRYTGDDLAIQNDWFWEYIGNLTAAVNGDSAEIKIPRVQLDNPENVLLFFYGNSAATAGTAIDLYPDNAYDAASVLRTRRFSYSVNVNNVPGNFAPVAFAQRIELTEGTAYPLTLTGFDQDGDALEYFVNDARLAGTITGTAPDLVYTDGVDGDLLIYEVSDGITFSDSRSIQFFVVPPPAVNNRPAANNQTYNVLPGTGVALTLTGTDADDDNLTYRLVNSPVNGVLSGSAPNFTYAAPVTATGVDSFTYVVNDGRIDSSPATVMINVLTQLPVNAVPQAESQNLTTAFETAISVNLLATDADNDPLSYSITTQPTLGSLSGTAPNLTYIPFANATGADSFTYLVNDGIADSVIATVVIDVQAAEPVNEAPVANGQSLTTAFGQPLDLVLTCLLYTSPSPRDS